MCIHISPTTQQMISSIPTIFTTIKPTFIPSPAFHALCNFHPIAKSQQFGHPTQNYTFTQFPIILQ